MFPGLIIKKIIHLPFFSFNFYVSNELSDIMNIIKNKWYLLILVERKLTTSLKSKCFFKLL